MGFVVLNRSPGEAVKSTVAAEAEAVIFSEPVPSLYMVVSISATVGVPPMVNPVKLSKSWSRVYGEIA